MRLLDFESMIDLEREALDSADLLSRMAKRLREAVQKLRDEPLAAPWTDNGDDGDQGPGP